MAVEPSVPLRKLVILEEGMLVGLANNHQFLSVFPFLSPLKRLTTARAGGCGKCSTAAKERSQLMQSAKMAIVGLGNDKKKQMKRLMNAETIQIKYLSGGGIKTYEF